MALTQERKVQSHKKGPGGHAQNRFPEQETEVVRTVSTLMLCGKRETREYMGACLFKEDIKKLGELIQWLGA